MLTFYVVVDLLDVFLSPIELLKLEMLEEDNVVCFICGKPEENLERTIECVQCAKSVHFRCKNLRGNAVLKARKRPFYCSVECADMFARTTRDTSGYDQIIGEIKLLAQSVRESKQESAHLRLAFEQSAHKIDALVKTSKAIEESQEFLSKQFDVLQKDFDGFKRQLGGLKVENERMRAEIGSWKNEQHIVSSRVDQLELELDRVNRGMVSCNAVILGIPMLEDENPKALVIGIGSVIGSVLDDNSITSARRLLGKNRTNQGAPILVSFGSAAIKEKLFEMKRAHGPLELSKLSDSFRGSTSRVVIRDELTAFGRALYQEAKELQSSMGYKYVWPGRNGKILIKRQDGGKIEEISCRKQIEDLKKNSAKRSLNTSSNMSPTSLSPVLEPASKRLQM